MNPFGEPEHDVDSVLSRRSTDAVEFGRIDLDAIFEVLPYEMYLIIWAVIKCRHIRLPQESGLPSSQKSDPTQRRKCESAEVWKCGARTVCPPRLEK